MVGALGGTADLPGAVGGRVGTASPGALTAPPSVVRSDGAATADPVSGPASETVTTPVAATASAAVPAVAASTRRIPRSRRRPALERRA